MNFIIKNLPKSKHIEDIEKLCSRFGRVLDCSTFSKLQHTQMACLKMYSTEEAEKAIEALNGSLLEGFTLIAEAQEPRSAKKPRKKDLKGLKRKRNGKKYLKTIRTLKH